MNGLWLAFLLGRWSMVTGWIDLCTSASGRNKREFVSVDARMDDIKKDQRSYEMLSRDSGKTMDDSVTRSIVKSPKPLRESYTMRQDLASPHADGRRTPDYFGHTARYHAPARSFSNPHPPAQSPPPQTAAWDGQHPRETYQRPRVFDEDDEYVNPLAMNRI